MITCIYSNKFLTKREAKTLTKIENEESWLFYCKKSIDLCLILWLNSNIDTNITQIATMVDMMSYKLLEINCDYIANEESMWIDIIAKLDQNFFNSKKGSIYIIITPWKQFSDLEFKNISLLRQIGAAEISSSLHNELLILITNLPEDEVFIFKNRWKRYNWK